MNNIVRAAAVAAMGLILLAARRARTLRRGLPPFVGTLLGALIVADRLAALAVALGLFEPDYWVNNRDIGSAEAIAKGSAMQRILSGIIVHCKAISLPCALVYAPTTVQYDPAGGSLERAVGVRVRPEWLIEQSELERRLERWAASLHVP